MMFETFISITNDTRERLKIKRSEFIASAHHIKTEKEVKEFISDLSEEFRDATHNCWAYKIGKLEHSSDAGEPSGTAGIPILGSIKSSGFDRIVVVVTRYFGGVKLGIRGLIDAYSQVAHLALNSAKPKEFFVGRRVVIKTDYTEFDKIAYRLRKAGYLYSTPPQFTEKVKLELFIPKTAKLDIPHEELSVDELPKTSLIRI